MNKKISLAVFLFSLLTNALAENEITALSDLQNKIVGQSTKILSEFEKHHIKTKDGIYQSIWAEEYNVVDYIDVVSNTVLLFNSVSDKNNELAKMSIWHNVSKMEKFCRLSLINLNEYTDEIKNTSVKEEVAIQTDYANKACEGIGRLGKFYYDVLMKK